ncbi:MAG: tRNA uridine-5-carboxymethylaminomethyl(34) synthesis GTPase MnmE [Ruminococcaceae bacterium]|nr:tRNA uridine-5-carboxymethylaminomethyl(34) synthesis GTPase MnmE [Oscillospiraceae bacterium]
MLGDTIAAISTPHGRGGVALLRVSGPDAESICARVFVAKNRVVLTDAPARTAIYGEMRAPDADGVWRSVDDGLATVFRAPNSFTGENTVELCCHGGILLTETILTALLTAGARQAEAGEFTRRAFLNGKLGLSSAEALGNLLEAQTREQITLAHGGLRGRLEARCEAIYTKMRHTLASIYVTIDYPDEDLADLSREEMMEAFRACEEELSALAHTYHTGHAIAEGIPTVICGRPNVGKSSLYNALVGRDAAIVTAVEGTTRDVLTETLPLGRVTLRLFDTAGLHETDDPVERIGIERAEQAMADAELILAVFNGSQPPSDEDIRLAESLRKMPSTVIAVINQSDLGVCDEAFYRAHFANCVVLSAKNGEGLEDLRACVERLFIDGTLNVREDAILTNARQHAAVLSALESVRRAIGALQAGLPIDLCCVDTETAMSSLAEVDGHAVSEDIVSDIFSHFCVGK